MCGLAGLMGLRSDFDDRAGTALVQRMCDSIAHRGPDDEGVERKGAIILGSRRLSIIDLSAAGHMPMADESGRWSIVYNGELYNFAELREALIEEGFSFRSGTDTEVVLKSFIAWGTACLPRFNGIFAFAIADHEAGTVTLVRDQFGVKPLYYARQDPFVVFSSEVKAIWAALDHPRLDKWRLVEWFLYHNCEGLRPDTLIEDVHVVRPGEALTIGPDGSTAHETWYSAIAQVDEATFARFDAGKPQAIVDEIEDLLVDSVRRQLVSDVPVGTLLSGGLDSSLITSIGTRHRSDLEAFHVSIAGAPDLDEQRYARQVADRLGIPLHSVELTPEGFRRALVEVVQMADMPLAHANAVAYHLVCRLAREHGVPVLLSGEGADEVFGGYGWAHRRTLWLQRLMPIWDRLPRRFHEIAELLVYGHARMPVTTHQFRNLLPQTVDLLDRYDRHEWRDRCLEAYGFVGRQHDRAVMASMLADLGDFLGPLLRRLDRASMASSVECRVPFLDPRLVQAGINLPMRYRVGSHADKWVLRRIAERHVPASLVNRKKFGFPLPLADYLRPLATSTFFRGGFCEEELGLGPSGITSLLASWERSVHFFFGLVALEIWGQIYFRNQSVAAIEARLSELEKPSPSLA